MAKVVALVSTICIIFAVSTVAHSHNQVFNIEGDVYCDPCRIQFKTTLRQKLSGATMCLVCTDEVTREVTYDVQGITNADGHYSLQVVGDHENDICDVSPIKRPRADYSEPMTEVVFPNRVHRELGYACRRPLRQPSGIHDQEHTCPVSRSYPGIGPQ